LANHPSALKRARQNEQRRKRNQSIKTRVRNLMKKVNKAVEDRSIPEAESALRQTVAGIHKASAKRVLHRRTADRYISRLSRKVSALSQRVS